MTEYEYDIEMRTQHGWELVDCQPTFALARKAMKIYEREQPGWSYRVNRVPVINPTMLTDPEGR